MSDRVINRVIWAIMLIMAGYFFYTQGWILSNFKNLSADEAKHLLNSGDVVLIDVRSEEKFKKDSILGAINIPSSKLKESLATIEGYREDTILLYSERGKESIDIARVLANRGFKVYNLKGGVVFWLRAGYLLKRD